MKIAALIPARSGSVRVRDKNSRLLGKYPLLGRKIKQLQSSKVDEIFLGSDDSRYLEIAEEFGATPILRSDFACDETVSTSNDMIADFTARIPDDFDIILWAHCTNPFLYARHYDVALELFQKNVSSCDSLLSVQKVQNHMWENERSPLNYNPWSSAHTLAKNLQPVYFQTGGIFIQWAQNIKKNHYFFGVAPKFILHSQNEVIDIDTEDDFLMAESLIKFMDKKEGFS
jgi:CMP-N,N'-diacetyllegionaminic acid synthase